MMAAIKDRLDLWWESRPARKLRKDRWAMVCMGIIFSYLVVAILVKFGWFANEYSMRVGEKYLEPSGESWKLWLGTDRQGRSIIVRMFYSAKVAIGVGLICAAIGAVVGSILGVIAGYFGKWIDDFVVWLYSTVQSIPYLLLLIMLTYVAGKGLFGIYVAFIATFWVGP
jgi:peptide/nickel transport system permease protein